MIYNYIEWLKNSDINYFEEFDNFLSKFPYFKTNKLQNILNILNNVNFLMIRI